MTQSTVLLGYQFQPTSWPTSNLYVIWNLMRKPCNSPCINLGERSQSLYTY